MMPSFKILVCCHKKVPVIRDDLFAPVLLGSLYASKETKDAFQADLWDCKGTNIAELHPYCAELTAIYLAWKNYEKLGNPDYIGLFHYRRFLNFGYRIAESDPWRCAFYDFELKTRLRYGWNSSDVKRMCDGYDLILPESERILDPKDWISPTTLEKHYKHAHYPEDFDLVLNMINILYPNYEESVAAAKDLGKAYFCNMFIMKRELFIDYAEWLFSIILQLKDKLPLDSEKYSGQNNPQRRVLGFLGERLFNIWIQKKKLDRKIKIREIQRLTGYLDKKEQRLFKQRYGLREYERVSDRVEFFGQLDKHFKNVDPEVVVHPCRNKTQPVVSVLVPVYNVEPFLEACVESLLAQTLKNIEFIFVDNASSDNSLKILMNYYDKDPRITIVRHTSNQGLSVSRNTALRYVSGKYFTYVDSDDICDQTMLEKLYRKAEELKADIVTCGVSAFVDHVSNSYLHRPLWWYGDYDKLLPLEKRPQQLMEPAAWCKLFNTRFVREIRHFQFRPNVLAWEDVPVMTLTFLQTNRIATVQESLYYYRIRSFGNLSNNMTSRHIEEFISGAINQAEILKVFGISSDSPLRSYIEEFKFEYSRWMLSKLEKTSISKYFKEVGNLFNRKDVKYLNRIFTYNRKAKIFYHLLKMRSSSLYFLAKFMWGLSKTAKKKLQELFHIGYEDSHRTVGLGPFYTKYLLKSDLFNLIKWLHGKIKFNREDSENKLECLRGQMKQYFEIFSHFKDREFNILSDLKESIEKLSQQVDEIEKHQNKLSRQMSSSEGNLATKEEKERARETKAMLDEMVEEFKGFYHAVWTTGWIDKWKDYYLENYSEINNKKKLLKKNLDDKSCELIERICNRNFELLPRQKDSDLFRYDHAHIYTADEIAGASQQLDFAKIKQKYVIPKHINNFEVPVFEFHCGLSLLPNSAKKIICNKDIIDGGAYWGDSALVISGYHPKKIYAFEPQPDNYGQLCETVSLNNLNDKVVTVKAGLGKSKEFSLLYSNEFTSASNLGGVDAINGGGELVANKVEIVTIDDYVTENNLDVGFIKLDIEGNELPAIQGALQTIKRFRPVLSIAIYHRPEDFFEIKPLIEGLNLGYRFMVRKIVYHDLVTEVILLGYVLNKEMEK